MRRPLPVRSPETGGGTRRAAEGEPEQAPTPTRARFEQAGSRLEMPQAWAPLDEEAGAAELTARLEQVLGDALPENLERLKPEMSMALSAHLHQHGLQREHDAPNVLSRNHRQSSRGSPKPRKEPQPQLSSSFHRLSNVVMCLATTLSTINNTPVNIF